LTAAEKAAAQAAFDKGLASKSSAVGPHGLGGYRLLVSLQVFLAVLAIYAAS
jgi:hypothetical protein